MGQIDELANSLLDKNSQPLDSKSRIPDPLAESLNTPRDFNSSNVKPIKQAPSDYGKSQYDFGVPIDAIKDNNDLADFRYQRQPSISRFANAGMNLLEKTGAYTLQNAGLVLGAPIAALTRDVSNMTDNFLVQAGDAIKNQVQEDFPIYKPSSYANESIWDKLNPVGSSGMSWWLDDVVDRAGLTAGMFLSGGASQMAGLGRVGLYGMNIIGQSALNAKETKEAIMNATGDENKAAEGAMNAFWETLPLSMGGSLLEVPQMFGTQRSLKSGLEKLFENGKAIERSYLPSTFKSNAAHAGLTAMEHSLNEGLQVAISDYNTAKTETNPDGTSKETRGIIPGILGTFIEGIDSPNLQNNLALGFIQGLLMSAGGAYANKSAKLSKLLHKDTNLEGKSYEQYNLDKQKESDDNLFDIINNAHLRRRFYRGDFINRNEDGSVKLDKDNNYSYDQEKLAEGALSLSGVQNNLSMKKHLVDTDNYHLAALLDNDEFSSFVYNFLDLKNGMDHVEAFLSNEKEAAEQDPNRLNDLDNFGSEITPSQQYNTLIKKAKALRQIYNDIKVPRPDEIAKKGDNLNTIVNFLNGLKFTQFSEASRQKYLNETIKKNNEKITSLKIENDISITTSEERINKPKNIAENQINDLIDRNTGLKTLLSSSENSLKIALNKTKQREALRDRIDLVNKSKEEATPEETKDEETPEVVKTEDQIHGNREELESPDLFTHPFKHSEEKNTIGEHPKSIQDILSTPDWKDKVSLHVSKEHSSTNTGRVFNNNTLEGKKVGIQERLSNDIDIKILWNNESIFSINNPNKFVIDGVPVDFNKMKSSEFYKHFYFGKEGNEYENSDTNENFEIFKANYNRLKEFNDQIKIWYNDQKITDPNQRIEIPKDAYDISLIAPLSINKDNDGTTLTDIPSTSINGKIVVWDNRISRFISGDEVATTQYNSGNKPEDHIPFENFKGKLALSILPNGLTTWFKVYPKHLDEANLEKVDDTLSKISKQLQDWGTEDHKEDYDNLLQQLDYFIAYKPGYNIQFDISPVANSAHGLLPAALNLQIVQDNKDFNEVNKVIFNQGVKDLDDLIKQFNESYFNKEKIQLKRSSFKENDVKEKFNPEKYETNLNPEVRGTPNVKFSYHAAPLITHIAPKVTEQAEEVNSISEFSKEDLEAMFELPFTLEDLNKEQIEEKQKEDEKKDIDNDEFTPFKTDGEYGKLNIKEAIDYIKKTTPSFIEAKDIDILVNKLHLEHIPFGAFANNIIYLNNNSKQGVEYHEILHSILRTTMNDEQIKTILKEVEKEYGTPGETKMEEFRSIYYNNNFTNSQLKQLILEENLANKFEQWKLNKENKPKSSLIQKFFNKIINFYKWVTGKRTKLERLFDKIDSGGFRNAKQKNNSFSKIGSTAVYKVLQGKGIYESKGVIATFTGLMRESGKKLDELGNITGRYNLDVNDIVANELKYYDINSEENQRLINFLPKDKAEKLISQYKTETEFYSNFENQKVIRDEVNKMMKSSDTDFIVEDFEDEEDRETRMRSFDRDATGEGGYDTLSKEIRAYFNTTLYNRIDEFGKEKRVAIDGSFVYSSTEQLLLGTKKKDIISKLIASAKNKPQTQAVVDRLIADTAYGKEDSLVTPRQKQVLTRFTIAFRKERYKELTSLREKQGTKTKIINDEEKVQDFIFDRWFNKYPDYINKEQFKSDIESFLKKVSGLNQEKWRFNNLPVAESLVKVLSDIGIDISESLVDLSFNKDSELKTHFDKEEKITEDQLSILKDKIVEGINPFVKGGEEGVDTGMEGTFKKWANTDKNFREDYFVPSWANPEGKTKYSAIMPNFALSRGREIKEELTNLNRIKEKQDNPYFHLNTLLQGKPESIQEVFKNNDLAGVGNIRREGKVGVSYKHLDPKSFKTKVSDLFLNETIPGYAYYISGVNADKKLFLATRLPVDKTLYTINEIQDKFLNNVFDTIFKQEIARLNNSFGRMQAKRFIYLPFLNEEENLKTLNATKVKNNITSIGNLDYESYRGKIKEQIAKYFKDEIEKTKEIFKDTENLLDTKALESYGSYDNFIGNYVLNYFLNVTGYNQLQIGDGAQFKDLTDYVKRASGWVAFHQSQEGREIRYAYINDYEYTPDPRTGYEGEPKMLDDGQVLAIVDHKMEFLRVHGNLPVPLERLFNKIKKGEKITDKDQQKQVVDLLSDKDVTYGFDSEGNLIYHKNSTFYLTRELTSYLNGKKLLPIPGKEHLHTRREFMEKHNIHQLVPLSVVKTMKPESFIDHKIFDSNDWMQYEEGEDFQIHTIDGKYQGEQMANDTKNEKPIVTGIQLLHLADTELSEENKHLGTELQDTLSKIHIIAMKQALRQLVNENYEKADNTLFFNKIRDQIDSSTPDASLDYFFEPINGESLGDPNLPQIRKKFQQYYLSHFKPAMVTKTMGDKKTIVGVPYDIIEDTLDNRIVSNEEYIDRIRKNQEEFNDISHENDKKNTRYKVRRLKTIFKDNGDIDYLEIVTTRRNTNLLGKSINEIVDIDEKLLEMLGIRIPTQSHHSMMRGKIVEFIPEYYGSSIIAAPEIYHFSGADNDVDSLFTYKYDTYKNGKGEIKRYGESKTDEDKWEEYKTYQLERNLDLTKEIERVGQLPFSPYEDNTTFMLDILNTKDTKLKDSIIKDAMKNLNLASSLEDFVQKRSPDNIGALSNQMLDSMLKILVLPDIQESLKSPASVDKMREAGDLMNKLREKDKVKDNFSTLSGLYNSWVNVNTGSNNIGPAVNASLANAVLTKYEVPLNEKFHLSFNDKKFTTFAADKTLARQKADDLSTEVSAYTDNAKEPLASFVGVPIELVSQYAVLTALGIPINSTSSLFINQPVIQELGEQIKGLKSAVNTEVEDKTSKFKVINNLKKSYPLPEDLNLNDDEMENAIKLSLKKNITTEERKTLNNIQAKALHNFLKVDAIAQNFVQVSQILSLSKGFGADYSALDKIKVAIKNLGLDKNDPLSEYQKNLLTFDFNKVLENNANIRTNIDILRGTEKASKNFSIAQTPFFKDMFKTSFEPMLKLGVKATEIDIVKSDLQSYFAMQAIVHTLKLDVDRYNNLLHGDTALIKEFKKLQQFDEFKKNLFIQFLESKPTHFTTKGKEVPNPDNRTGLELLVANNRIKLSTNTKEKYIDEFNKLRKSNNPEIVKFAKASIAYLLAKDNFNFKTDSFISIISPEMFAQKGSTTSYSYVLAQLNKELTKDKPDLRKLTGKSSEELVKQGIEMWARHIRNQNLLKNIFNKSFFQIEEDNKKKDIYNVTRDKVSNKLTISLAIDHSSQMKENTTFTYTINDKGFITKINYPDFFREENTLYKKISSSNKEAIYQQVSKFGNQNQMHYHMSLPMLDKMINTDNVPEFTPYSQDLNDISELPDTYDDALEGGDILDLGDENNETKSNNGLLHSKEDENKVNYSLKVIDALNKPNAQSIIDKGIKNKWEWWKIGEALGIPKLQINILQQSYEKGNYTVDSLIVDILANNSYSVEINITKDEGRYESTGFEIPGTGEWIDTGYEFVDGGKNNSEYYSNLTVPGGTNYTENEISTPLITPSIKGHAQFSTDNGIGWFRSDNQITGLEKKTIGELGDFYSNTLSTKVENTRRILEIQSDLFQKGRDKEDLALTPTSYNRDDYQNKRELFTKPANQFLQLLNKDNNWVTFFVKSIIQDSIKKGYEKVLFPSGNTASKVEGHETIEENMFHTKRMIGELEDHLKALQAGSKNYRYEIDDNTSDEQALQYDLERVNSELITYREQLNRLETEGISSLKPIFAFYENQIKNILKKNYPIKEITDEYSNTWNEVSLDKERDSKTILLSKDNNEFEADKVAKEIYPKLLENNSKSSDVLKVFTKSNNTVLASFSKKLLEKLHNDVSIEILSENALDKYLEQNNLQRDEESNAFYNSNENDIILRKDRVTEDRLAYTLLHEIIHAQTYHELQSNSRAAKQFNALYDYVVTQLNDEEKKMYPFSNSDELIAGILKKNVIEVLSSKPAVKGRLYKNLWEEVYATIKDFIKKLFGFTPKEMTLYDNIFAAASQVFENAYNKQQSESEFNERNEGNALVHNKESKIESPFEQQQIFFKRRLSTLERRLSKIKSGTNEYRDQKAEIEALRRKVDLATLKQDKSLFEELGRDTLKDVEEFVKGLEGGSRKSTDTNIQYTMEVLNSWKEFKGLLNEVRDLTDRIYPFIEDYTLNEVKQALGDSITLDMINSQTKDIGTFTKGWGSLSDVANYIASTIGIVIKRAQNRSSTKSKAERDKIQEKVDNLFKYAKKNNINHNNVYDIFNQEHEGTNILTQGYFGDGRINPNYQKIQNTPELKEFYDFYRDTIREHVKGLPGTLPYYFIPNIYKTSIKSTLQDLNPIKTRKVGKDYNEEFQSDMIPLKYYRPIPSEHKSKDLGNSLLAFVRHSNEFNQLSDILPTVRVLQESLTKKRNADGVIVDRKFSTSSNSSKLITGENSNLYKMVESVINMQVKGNMKTEEGKIKVKDYFDKDGNQVEDYLDTVDLADNILHWNSMLRIGFSPITAASNVIFGDISNVIEAIGGRFFGIKELTQATKIFFKQTFNNNSVMNHLLEELNPLQELDDYVNINESALKSKMSKEKLQEYMYSMQKKGEKYLQGRTLLAVMIKKGYLTSDGELTDKWKNTTEQQKEELVDLTQRLNQSIHGRYSQREAATWSQSIWYRLAFQFRKWIPAFFETRIGPKQIDARLRVEIEGRYRTFYNLVKNLRDTLNRVKQGNLTELEIYNMRKNLTEITLTLITVFSYSLLHGGSDDDKKKRRKNPIVKTALSLLSRASSDLTFFYSPQGALQMAKNAVPMEKLVEDLTKLTTTYLPAAFYLGKSQYKTGSRKGDNKFYSTLRRNIPGLKSVEDIRRILNPFQLEELK